MSRTTAIRQQLASASKAEQAAEISAVLDHIARLHEASFQPASPRQARPAQVDNQLAILESQLSHQLRGISRFKLRQRRRAKHDAAWAAYRQIDDLYQADRRRRADEQARLDERWARLQANDPDVVLQALVEAFADNEASAAPLDVQGDGVSVLVYLPSSTVLPERQPSITAAGNLSLRKMTKAQAAEHYKRLVAGFVLVTAKEAFAVAPGLQQVSVLAVMDGCGEPAEPAMECLVAVRLSRAKLTAVDRRDSDSVAILTAAAEELRLNERGAARAWEPLQLEREPDIQAVLRVMSEQSR